ncbi:hypothetical protein SAMD00019534_052570, partial [Acytostelium subglobosum LB1]|uniref:hypothetical protein n=1 Tax=Acytostelium subglobosum LB1 TaxID=1410327 RepID=UPI00064505A5
CVDQQIRENEVRRIVDLLINGRRHKECVAKMLNERHLAEQAQAGQLDHSMMHLLKQYNRTKDEVAQVEQLQQSLADYIDLQTMAKSENDASMLAEAAGILDELYAQCQELEFKSLMSGQSDHESCYLEIHAGAGGTDSMDWAEMLHGMYSKWALRKGYQMTFIDESRGEYGYKRVVVKIDGEYAHGWCRSESGIHKLIRISPFDSSGKRHTSFASVLVYPVADDSIVIDIQPKDLVIETMKSSGPGGQHVNKTESAVRITHTPSGIMVTVSEQRSQHQNKSIAMELIKAKLMAIEVRKKEQQEQSMRSELGVNGWASDKIVRTYTVHPQCRVKDQRTNQETMNLDAIMQGEEELDIMIKAALS